MQTVNSIKHLSLCIPLFWISFSFLGYSQTTFTESAAAYNLDIGGNKDGGHAWADYDLDGDYDIVINRNGSGYLLRNDGGSFTDVTSTLAPDFSTGSLERTALFVDFNNDGYPDVFRNKHNDIRIYLQDPATNRFGDGVGGTTPSQQFTSLTDGLNSEGAGALDYDGDGDLDLFIDNHNYGIDILQNDGNGFFTHVTRKADSPNPPYDVNDASTWPLGLVQDATDGDYGSATDFNDDGWVDIVVRKRNQVDLFTNLGGTFQDGTDIDDANNSNKGAVAFGDLDNDGDFDLFWTENGDNQIHRNNGDGTWTAMGTATGIPINFSGQIEGLAFGDVDNDGDLDIFLTGNSASHLYLNNGSLSFSDSGLSFNTSGEGCTFVDIDNDGDLDLYQNRNGSNSLYINNLGATARANHVFIDVIEDRDSFGLTGTEERFGIGATAKILDCDGNVISGTREVNGGFGHGTMEPGVIHFGLPGGPNTPIVLEIGYPSTTSGRVVVRSQITPSDFNNGSINLVDILPDVTNLDPIAQDDNINTSQNVPVTFDALLDNGNGVDSDPDGGTVEVISITQPTDGTATLNGDGTITYDPGSFVGSTSFTYTIGDNPICSFASGQDTATVFVTVSAQPDSDADGIFDNTDLDDDNDGILDSVECPNGGTILWVTGGTAGTEEQNAIDKLTALGYTVTVVDDDVGGNANNYAATFIYEDALSGTVFANVSNLTTTERGVITSETFLHDEILGANQGITTNTNLVNITNNTHPITTGLSLGNYDIGDGSFHANGLLSGTVLGLHPNGEVAISVWEPGDAMDVGTAPGRRAIVPHSNSNGGFNAAGEDLLVNAIIWTATKDTDKDGVADCLDPDSDGDGCGDADEAYGDANADSDDNGMYGTGNPPINGDGTVTAASYGTPADGDTNTAYDFLEVGSAPNITSQPVDTTICPGCTTNLTVVSDADTFQWQMYNGSSWVDLVDAGIYSGTLTPTMTITNPTNQENNAQFRVVTSNSYFVCGSTFSNQVTLTIEVNTVITNRRITYRVNKN